jgi:hypothetical protein
VIFPVNICDNMNWLKTFQVPAIIGHSNRFKKVDSSKSQKPNLVRSISSLQSSLDPKNKH